MNRDYRGGLVAAGAREGARSQLRSLVELLEWARSSGSTIGGLTQCQFEEFVFTHSDKPWLGVMVDWLAQGNMTRRLSMPHAKRALPTIAVSEAERLKAESDLLADLQLAAQVRLAGIFVVSFGQDVARVSRMRSDQLRLASDRGYVTFGRHEVELAKAMLPAAAEAIEMSRQQRGATWLFPGKLPLEHRSASSLSDLIRSGVKTPVAGLKMAARFQIASQLPPSIMSDVIRLGIECCLQYASLSNSSWSELPMLRKYFSAR